MDQCITLYAVTIITRPAINSASVDSMVMSVETCFERQFSVGQENDNHEAITDETSPINPTEVLKMLNNLLNLISIHKKETLISIKDGNR